MKTVLTIGLLLCCIGVYAQPSGYLISTAVAASATYTTDLIFAGMIIHASAANAYCIVYDGATEIFRYKMATDEMSAGHVFSQGGIPCGTNIIVQLTNCTATLFRRKAVR